MNANQLFIWRRFYREGLLVPPDARASALLSVTITGERAEEKIAVPADVGRIEIECPVDTASVSPRISTVKRCVACSIPWNGGDPGSVERA